MARCQSGSPAAAAAAAEWLRQQVIHPPIPPFYTQSTFAHTSSQVTWFWRVTRPPQWTQQWRPKTERESKPPWRKSLHFPAPCNAAEHTPSFYVQHQPQNLIVSLSLFFFRLRFVWFVLPSTLLVARSSPEVVTSSAKCRAVRTLDLTDTSPYFHRRAAFIKSVRNTLPCCSQAECGWASVVGVFIRKKKKVLLLLHHVFNNQIIYQYHLYC